MSQSSSNVSTHPIADSQAFCTLSTRHIIILGAGVTGLQTALSLLRTGLYAVTIIAEHFPGDLDIEYTSPWAGGHWRSHAGLGPEDEELRSWDEKTYVEWMRVLGELGGLDDDKMDEVEKTVGLGVRESVMYWTEETAETKDGGEGLWWNRVVRGFGVLSREERERVKLADPGDGKTEVIFGARYDSVCINIPQYLLYLHEQVTTLGAQFIKRRISPTTEGGEDGLKSLVGELEDIFSATASDHRELYGIVLASGLSSRRYLPKHEAQKLFPIRGQTVLVKGESKKAITHIFQSPDELTYIVPRPGSGCTIIGGCKQPGDWNDREDTVLTSRILNRAKALSPELLDTNGEFQVVSVQVGRRPGRKGGPRVELENTTIRSGLKVIYAYGHAGAGYQNSVGSAAKVVSLLSGK